MTEMIAAEPGLARRILARHAGADSGAAALAAAVAEAARNGEPIIVTGCGTSEHASLGVADILREAARAAGLPGVGAVSAQAFELSLEPPGSGLVVGVSHEGATSATNAALAAARDAGARTALITVTGRSPGAALADIVLETGELDQSWCHTIGYVSPMLAASAVGAHLSGRALDGDTVARVRNGSRAISPTWHTSSSSPRAPIERLRASSSSRSKRPRGSHRPTGTSRPSSTVTCRPPARIRDSC